MLELYARFKDYAAMKIQVVFGAV